MLVDLVSTTVSFGSTLVIIANTTKGKGVKFMENTVLWHYKNLSAADYQKAIKEIK